MLSKVLSWFFRNLKANATLPTTIKHLHHFFSKFICAVKELLRTVKPHLIFLIIEHILQTFLFDYSSTFTSFPVSFSAYSITWTSFFWSFQVPSAYVENYPLQYKVDSVITRIISFNGYFLLSLVILLTLLTLLFLFYLYF